MFWLQPHHSRSFKLSSDPFFIEKVRDIVGLYDAVSALGKVRKTVAVVRRDRYTGERTKALRG